MKKTLLILTCIAFSAISSQGQQLPLYSQYMLNRFLINPAIAGSSDFVPLILTARSQWSGIEGAPKTQAISWHTKVPNRNMGIGGYLFNDNYGPIKSTGLLVAYSYHIKLNKFGTKLSFGLSGSAFQYKLDKSDIDVVDENDNVITQSKERIFMPDANFGIYLYNKRYFVGISGAHLIKFDVKFAENAENYGQLSRHYFASAGYRIYIMDQLIMAEPSVMLKTTDSTPSQVDLSLAIFYKSNYWAGISYRTGDAVVALAGIKYNKYFFGYAYDFTLSEIMHYSNGSHEIMVGFDLGDPNKVIKSPRYL